MMPVFPSVPEGFMARTGCGFEGRYDLPRLASLGDRIETVTNAPAQFCCRCSGIGQRNIMRRSQPVVAAVAFQLHAQHPGARATGLHDQAQTPAIDMATGLRVLHFQYCQRHQVRVPVRDSYRQKRWYLVPQSFPHFSGNSGDSGRPTANTLQDKSLILQSSWRRSEIA